MSYISSTLSQWVKKETGIILQPGRQPLLEQRLESFCKHHDLKDGDDLCKALTRPPHHNFVNEFLSTVTINESLWFRDGHPFTAMVEMLKTQLESVPHVRVWSAACSTGQEPYSLAMCLHEQGITPQQCQILATDLSPKVVQQAQLGQYDEFAISRGLTPNRISQYFEKNGRYWQVNKLLKSYVSVKEHNLANSSAALGQFHMVLLRNVLIYFPDDFRKELIARIADLMTPNAGLFIGGCESILGVHPKLKLKSINRSAYYRKESL